MGHNCFREWVCHGIILRNTGRVDEWEDGPSQELVVPFQISYMTTRKSRMCAPTTEVLSLQHKQLNIRRSHLFPIQVLFQMSPEWVFSGDFWSAIVLSFQRWMEQIYARLLITFGEILFRVSSKSQRGAIRCLEYQPRGMSRDAFAGASKLFLLLMSRSNLSSER